MAQYMKYLRLRYIAFLEEFDVGIFIRYAALDIPTYVRNDNTEIQMMCIKENRLIQLHARNELIVARE